jgi:hypothetical protein
MMRSESTWMAVRTGGDGASRRLLSLSQSQSQSQSLSQIQDKLHMAQGAWSAGKVRGSKGDQ